MSFTIKNKLTIQNALSKSRDVVQAISDPFFKYVTALIKGTSTNNGTNNTFLDSSPNNFTLTRTGTPTQGTFSPYLENYSVQFNGSTDCISVPSNSALTLGSGDFTIEFWVNTTTASYTFGAHVVGTYNGTSNVNGWTVSINRSTGGTYGVMVAYNNTIIATTNGYLPILTWNHVAVVRGNGTLKIYVNGVEGVSISNSYNDTNLGTCYIGSEAGASGTSLIGYVSNVRFVKGTALYNGNFAVPTTKLSSVSGTSLLTLQDNRFVDKSSNGLTLTPSGTPKISAFSPFAPTQSYTPSVHGGSGYFSGTGNYISTPNSANLGLSGDFTVEAWVNWTSRPANAQCIINGQQSGGFNLYWDGGTYQTNYLVISNRLTNQMSHSFLPTLGQWYHIAVSRVGTTMRLFINGTLVNTVTNSISYSQTNMFIGSEASSAGLNGYISDVRVIKGTGLYTSSFSVPTSPLPAISNTQFLGNFSNGNVLDYSSKGDITTSGDTKTTSSVKKNNPTSIQFDGSGDYITYPSIPTIKTTSTFTLEYWAYYNSFPASSMVGDFSPTSGTYNWGFGSSTNNDGGSRVVVVYGLNSGVSLRGNTILTTGNWIHHALCVNNGVITVFINGVQQTLTNGSTTITTPPSTTGQMVIGGFAGAQYLNGYIDELRITTGVVRYTSNFTPPSTSLPTQ